MELRDVFCNNFAGETPAIPVKSLIGTDETRFVTTLQARRLRSVRLKAQVVREVKVLFRQTLSGL
jgi:hypothetical protein